jgi:SagB-type dehydrogenase family enzyme
MVKVFLKRSQFLIIEIHCAEYRVTNYVQRKRFTCNTQVFEMLRRADTWTELEEIIAWFPLCRDELIVEWVSDLIGSGGLVLKNSEVDSIEERVAGRWDWGSIAGYYHFSTRGAKYLTESEAITYLQESTNVKSKENLYTTNLINPNIVELPRPTLEEGILSVLANRRTNRCFEESTISLDILGECLFGSLAITGFYHDPLMGALPVKMTPSGGARNPYEAFIYALNVEKLEKGLYHYSAFEHNIAKIDCDNLPQPSALLAGQEWANAAAAVLILVANIERTSWKYREPTAYRVVFIEAGHIAQNICTIAVANGLTANPTAAISDFSAT